MFLNFRASKPSQRLFSSTERTEGLLGNQSSLASLNCVDLRPTQPAGPELLEGTVHDEYIYSRDERDHLLDRQRQGGGHGRLWHRSEEDRQARTGDDR